MKNRVLKVNFYNWQGLRDEKEWIIYEDFTVDFSFVNYLTNNETKKYSFQLEETEFKTIMSELKKYKESPEILVSTTDGNGYSFIEYQANEEVWKREPKSITSIAPLEKIIQILQYKSIEFEISI